MGRTKIPRTCQNCALTFQGIPESLYCSQTCYRAVKRPRRPSAGVTTACKNCGKPVFRPGKQRPGVHCSAACYRSLSPTDRFWAKVDKTPGHGPKGECWIWIAAVDKDGYGHMWRNESSRNYAVHRFSWEQHNGPIPDGLGVLHHCDNPPCIRPDHLYCGTTIDNVRDRTVRGRERGELHGMAIVNESQVRTIRHRYATEKISQIALGKEYGLSQTAISQIVLRKCWTHI